MVRQNLTSDVVVNGKKLNTYTEPPMAIAREREAASFDIREMTYFLDGGKKQTEWTEKVWLQLQRSPAFFNEDYYDYSGDKLESRVRTMAKVAAISNLITDGRPEGEMMRTMQLCSVIDPQAYTRLGVHFGLFISGVRSSGTSEQFNYWVHQGALTLSNFFGCFAMTELGHGSNVAGLETTATYDKSTEEFVINTPTTAATKWWIGGAAHTATHTLCYARLIVDGKDHGVRNFVVPLRNTATWDLLPGIAIGDIGKKVGRDGIDNGWIQFSGVRIPRLFMMMRYAKVTADGTVIQPPLAQLAYGALIGGRVSMVHDSYTWARRFTTIAIRYAAARRQFSKSPDKPEVFLIDYTFHQRRLMPRLAYAFAMNFASKQLERIHASTSIALQKLDQDDKEGLSLILDDIKELFGISAGLKAFCTWATSQIIDECRQACGGQGYSGYNGFGQGYADWAVQLTWEGDNNVLTLSAGRQLLQTVSALRQGKHIGEAAQYINNRKGNKLSGRSLEDPSVVIEGWETASAAGINNAADIFEKAKKEGVSHAQALEDMSQVLYDIVKIHTRLYIVRSFFEAIKSADQKLQNVLKDVGLLFALWSIENEAAVFLRYGFLEPNDLGTITDLVNKYSLKVREQCIPLTDAFNQPDFVINAPIGNYDGDIYKNYFDKVNSRNPKINTHAPYYKSLMEPYFKRTEITEPDLSDMEEEERESEE